MKYGVYRVTGRRSYRGHEPGTTFEANLDPAVAQRAIGRGDIRLIRHVTPDLVPGSYRLHDWPPEPPVAPPTTGGAAVAPLSIKEEK